MRPLQGTGCRDEIDGARIEAVRRAHGPEQGAGPREYYALVIPAKAGLEDFEPKTDKEFGRQPKFCRGLGMEAGIAFSIRGR
jgi:hypothetical protein